MKQNSPSIKHYDNPTTNHRWFTSDADMILHKIYTQMGLAFTPCKLTSMLSLTWFTYYEQIFRKWWIPLHLRDENEAREKDFRCTLTSINTNWFTYYEQIFRKWWIPLHLSDENEARDMTLKYRGFPLPCALTFLSKMIYFGSRSLRCE